MKEKLYICPECLKNKPEQELIFFTPFIQKCTEHPSDKFICFEMNYYDATLLNGITREPKMFLAMAKLAESNPDDYEKKMQIIKQRVSKNSDENNGSKKDGSTLKPTVPMPEKPMFSKGFIVYLIAMIVIAIVYEIVIGNIGGSSSTSVRIGVSPTPQFLIFAVIAPFLIYLLFIYLPALDDYWFAKRDFEGYRLEKIAGIRQKEAIETYRQEQIERERLSAENNANKAPWETKYFVNPCPHCGHYKVRYSKWDDKRGSFLAWGILSDKIDKEFKCDNCKRMW